MASSTFMVGDRLTQTFSHHNSYEDLWNLRWKNACSKGIYPFAYGALEDFEMVAKVLIDKKMKEPYDWDAYANAFAPRAEALVSAASDAEMKGDIARAAEFYHRASALYRISRYPIPRSGKQWEAWEQGKAAFLKGQRLVEYGVHQINIPHTAKIEGEGAMISAYGCFPTMASTTQPAPMVLIASGLDGYRTDNCIFAEGLSKMGLGLLVFEIPGTGDSPALAHDPTSVDRLMTSILQWCTATAEIDETKICLWGLSTGGGFALRSASTMRNHLRGVVAQGGPVHRTFDREWLDRVDQLEYPFDLAEALAIKFGYGSDLQRFKQEVQEKFSLLSSGVLDQPCTRTLLINGTDDTIFPIDDMWLALQHGSAKEARFFADTAHMGEPFATPFIFNWIFDLLGCDRHKGDVQEAVRATIMPIKYSLSSS